MRNQGEHSNSTKAVDCGGIEQFYVVGINHNCADATTRSLLAINNEQHLLLLDECKAQNINDVIALNTCNRTEIYSYGNLHDIEKILSQVLGISESLIRESTYHKVNRDAVYHLFKVAAGLDSQILGDYEIQGQFKKAAQLSKKRGLLSPLTERLVNFAFKASKEIKSKTTISKGTVSVSFAAIEVLKQKVTLPQPKALVIGTGKFGSNIAKNVANYLPNYQLTVTNRSAHKAEKLARELDIEFIDYKSISEEAINHDVIIVCASGDEYVIIPECLKTDVEKMVLDLAIPNGVCPKVKQLSNVTVMDVDQISAMLDKTLERRKAELPTALTIMHDTIKEFIEWHKIYLQRWFVLQVKETLYELDEQYPPTAEVREKLSKNYRVQKAIDRLVVDLKDTKDDKKGCQYLAVINDFLDLNNN